MASSFEQQIRVSADISPAERAVGKLTTGLSRIEKLAKGSLGGLKNTRLNFDTRAAEQQISRLKQGIAGLNQRVRVRVEEIYSRSNEQQQGGGGVAILGGGRKQPGAAALGSATAALQQHQDALNDLIGSSDRYERLQQAQAAAADKLATKTEELSQAQRRLKSNQDGFADKGKTLAASLRDSTNAVEMRTRALERYQQELADTSAAVYRYGAAERRVAAELNRAEYNRTQGGLSFDQRLANRRKQNQFKGTGGKAAAAGVASAGFFIPGLSEVTTGAAAGFAVGGVKGGVIGAAAAGVTALTAAAVTGSGAIAEWQANLDRARIALQGISGSASEYKSNLQGIAAVSRDLNVPISDATQQFTSLRAAMAANGNTAAESLAVYRNLVTINKALGGDSEKLNGILLATTQIFSKGKVTAEELRGQLGERLPGAVADFAKSMGITTAQLDKLLEKGQVTIADFVRYTETAAKKYESTAKRIANSSSDSAARLSKAWEDFKEAIGPALKEAGSALQEFATNALKAITPVIDKLNEMTRGLRNNRLFEINTKLLPAAYQQRRAVLMDPAGQNNPQNQAALKFANAQINALINEKKELEAILYSRTQTGSPNPNTKPDPNAPTEEELKRRQDALEKELGIRSELRQLAIQQAEVDAAAGRIGKDRLSQLYAQGEAMEKLLRMQLDDIGASQDDPRLKQAKTGLAIATYQQEGKQLQQEIDDIVQSINELSLEGANLRRNLLGGQLQSTESPLETAIREVKEQLQDADQQALQLLQRLDELAGTRPESAAARSLLGNLRGDLAETDPNKLASQRLTQGDQQGMEQQQRSLQLQLNALREGRVELTGMEELLARYGADWEKLDSTVKGHLVDLARTNDALAEQIEKVQQLRADAESLSGITVTGIQDAIVASVTGGDIRSAFSEMFAQLGDQFLTMGLRPLQQWLTDGISKLLGLTLADATQTAAIGANTAAVTGAGGAVVAATPIITGATAAVTANTAAVTANTAAVAAAAGADAAGAAGSATSSILGMAGSIFGAAGSAFGGGAFGSSFNPLSTTKLVPGGIFEGGGYTGNAPRAGGLDGKGGFPAILHPNETVVDHRASSARAALKGGEGGAAPTINIQTGNVVQFEGANYVSMADFEAGLAKAANQGAERGHRKTLDKLRQSPQTRRSLGM